jgi:arylsulfatase A-like enzyme/Flp pilus assembly protein TadD
MVDMRFLLAAAGAAGLVALVGCRSSKQEQPVAGTAKLRPINVVVVTLDTLRADRLGCYGYKRIETPSLDRFASEGVLFENATAQTPLTPPSHASMFTGQYPNRHKVRNTGGFVLQSSSTTMAEIFQQQGWDTAAFIGASVLKKLFGFSQGFAVYDDQMPKPNDRLAREYPERPAADVVNRAVAWLNTQSGKPFFLWVHLFDPHLPLTPPEPFRTKYAGRLYDGEVAYVDRELGRLFEAIGKKSPADKTLIAILSDHGESLGDHGEFTHGVFLYESTMELAFLMKGPGVPAGLRVKQQARTIDLLPTVLDLLGGRATPETQGVSLVPAFGGKPAGTDYSYAETLYPKMNMGWTELRAVRTNRWKYIRAPKPELYDLEKDRDESSNVIGQHPEEVRKLEDYLKKVAAAGGGVNEKIETSLADQKTLDALKSLGYLSGHTPREFQLTGEGIDPKDRISTLKLIMVAAGAESGLPLARRIELFRKGLEQDPTNPSLVYHLGGELEKAGRYDEAKKLYLDSIGKGFKSGRLHSRAADLYLREGNKDAAIAEYEKAAQINPSDVESQVNLATAYLEKGRVADSERIFHWILASGEQNAAAYNGLGLIAVQRQEFQAARANFEKAVQIDPDIVEAHMNLGLLYQMAGDIPRARTSFQTFVAKAPRAQYGEIIAKVKAELAAMQ